MKKEIKEVYIVGHGDVESHNILAVFENRVAALADAEKRASMFPYVRDNKICEAPEIALWSRKLWGGLDPILGYLSVEKWKVSQ